MFNFERFIRVFMLNHPNIFHVVFTYGAYHTTIMQELQHVIMRYKEYGLLYTANACHRLAAHL